MVFAEAVYIRPEMALFWPYSPVSRLAVAKKRAVGGASSFRLVF
jgi:hypothetical protein